MTVEIVCILDRSGSMQEMQDEAISGFNAFLKEQQRLPGEARMTLVLFDHEYSKIYDGADIKLLSPMTAKTYVPRGMTALYDAICKTIDEVGARLAQQKAWPEKVIVAILTDGYENMSRTYSMEDVRTRIKHQSEKYGWEFIFLAANQDAFVTGSQLGIAAAGTANFTYDSAGLYKAYATINQNVTQHRMPHVG